MREIGGFFGIELGNRKNNYHKDGLYLNTGRGCLNLIIHNLEIRKLYVPYYTCDSLLSPLKENNIPFEYFGINKQLEINREIELEMGDYIIYINYFGIKSSYVKHLLNQYSNKIIIDNTQAFFEKRYNNVNSFNSARKFFGVPDGACLYSTFVAREKFHPNSKIKYDYLIERLIGDRDKSYQKYKDYEKNISNDIYLISTLSNKLLMNIDYNYVKLKRRLNYNHYNSILGSYNSFELNDLNEEVPLCYPFLPTKEIDKSFFFENKIFLPTYWTEVLDREGSGYDFEKMLSKYLLPLPVDQRYNLEDITYVSERVLELL